VEIGGMDFRPHTRSLPRPLKSLETSELRVRLLEASRHSTCLGVESRTVYRRAPMHTVGEAGIMSIEVSEGQMELHLLVVELTLRMPLEEHATKIPMF